MSSELDKDKPSDLASDKDNKGVKRSAGESDINVHTANDWEHAHLEGGDERKLKFLRLMGAGKKEHTGKVTIGEQDNTRQHGRSDKEEVELESTLEKQYDANLEYKLSGGARRHKGLGFQEEEKSIEEPSAEAAVKGNEEKKNDQDAEQEDSGDNSDRKTSEKVKNASGDNSHTEESKTPDSTKKYSLSFVKASS